MIEHEFMMTAGDESSPMGNSDDRSYSYSQAHYHHQMQQQQQQVLQQAGPAYSAGQLAYECSPRIVH